MSTLHALLPYGIDDPGRPSGGNVYDRRALDGLRARGWTVHEHEVAGPWPRATPTSRTELAAALRRLPDDALTVVDGLLLPEVADLVAAARRLRLVALAHMAFGQADPGSAAGEERAMRAAAGVVTTSGWTRGWLLEHYGLPRERVHVVEPGVDPGAVAAGTPEGGELLCVGAVTRGKGHDVLLAALTDLADLPWRCRCVGSLDVEPRFAADVRRTAEGAGLAERVVFTGALGGAELDSTYTGSDLLVLASRGESYGMVVTEALAHGVPVVATDVGGVAAALGHADGARPGELVPVDDPAALAEAVRRWLGDPDLRERWRAAARVRRSALRGWSETAEALSRVLADLLSEPPGHPLRMSR